MSDSSRTTFAAMRSLIGDGFAAPQAHALDALDTAIAATFGATPPPADPSPADQPHTAAPGRDPGHRLGALSERYESGGRGPGTVSSGRRDPGGVSYGLYQMATNTGTAAAFIRAEGSRWSADFAGKKPGTPTFSAAWQAVAQRDGAAFGAAQHAFIERTHYRPAVGGVRGQTGLDLDTRADAVRDACWSVAVQHGAAIKILCRAVGAADAALARNAAHYDRALVEAIYVARSDYVRKVASTLAPPAGQTLLDVVARRYPGELAQALAMLPS